MTGPTCAGCGNDGTTGALYLTVDARYIPETKSWRIVEREDDGGMTLDCLACDHRTGVDRGDTPLSYFPYDTDLPAKEA